MQSSVYNGVLFNFFNLPILILILNPILILTHLLPASYAHPKTFRGINGQAVCVEFVRAFVTTNPQTAICVPERSMSVHAVPCQLHWPYCHAQTHLAPPGETVHFQPGLFTVK